MSRTLNHTHLVYMLMMKFDDVEGEGPHEGHVVLGVTEIRR
jgi:hypothetical protein